MRPTLSVVIGAVMVMLCASCGNSSSDVFAAQRPDAILSAALRAATKLGGVHYVLHTKGSSAEETVTGDAESNAGAQYVVSGSDMVVAQLIGTAAFLRGNPGGLEEIFGMTPAQATQYAGQWIEFRPTDSIYRSVAQAVTLRGVLASLKPTGSLEKSTQGKVSGHSVVGVRGSLSDPSKQGVSTFWVATSAPTVPIGVEAQTNSVTQFALFTKWGERFHLVPPSGAVAFSTLPTK